MMPRIATRRAVLAQAWFAAKKRIDVDGASILAAEEEAGRLLDVHDSANVAFVLCTFEAARPLLAEVVKEEGGDVTPLGRTGR